MTSKNCLTGTDRVYDFSHKIEADIYVNIQGDEPLLDFKEINKFVKIKKDNFNYVINGMCSLTEHEDPGNPNIPKVVVNKENVLVYMSRLPIPGTKDLIMSDKINYKKQVCIYALNRFELEAFGKQKSKSYIEEFEDIEVLRFFDLNIPIKMIETKESSLAIDVIEDVSKVEEILFKIEGKS